MDKNRSDENKAIELRRRAEKKSLLLDTKNSQVTDSIDENRKLVHELRVHQIELEMQNEELRRVQNELEASRARYFDLYDLAPVGYLILNGKSTILEANLTSAVLLKMPRNDLINYSFYHFIQNEDQDIYLQHAKNLSKSSTPQACNLQLKRKDGSRFWAQVEMIAILDGEGLTAIRVVISDISLIKKAEAGLLANNIALQKALQIKDNFLTSMGHELRMPLTSILSLTGSLIHGTHGELSEGQSETILAIEKSGQHLLSLINDVIDIANLQSEKLELKLSLCSVIDICNSSLQLVGNLAKQKNQRLGFSSSDEIVIIRVDERRLRQILVNLLNNAIKFTPDGGNIELEVKNDPASQLVRINITDTGIGIKEEDVPHLFQSFTQLSPGTSRKYDGAGLGLLLVKQLVELHRGNVSVESTFGKGSCFTVMLPWNVSLEA